MLSRSINSSPAGNSPDAIKAETAAPAVSMRSKAARSTRAVSGCVSNFTTISTITPTTCVPTSPATGGFVLRTEGGASYYEMAVDVRVDPAAKTDLHVVVEVNMSESFRWEDQALAGYAPSVYDTTPTSFEPIRRFGANTYAVKVE